MDVDRDKHFSVSDLQALEEEDNRVSGQAVEKNTPFWNIEEQVPIIAAVV